MIHAARYSRFAIGDWRLAIRGLKPRAGRVEMAGDEQWKRREGLCRPPRASGLRGSGRRAGRGGVGAKGRQVSRRVEAKRGAREREGEREREGVGLLT